MPSLHTATIEHRSRLARRLLVIASLVALLGGCYQRQLPIYPTDYRVRHPITLKEGRHTVEVFLGPKRGGLTPTQRADVLSFAQNWRRNATSGVIINVPRGKRINRAAAPSLREVKSILAASGVPQRAMYVRRYHSSSTSLPSIKISYSKVVAHAGPCGLWPHDLGPAADIAYNENMPYWNLGCATQRNLAAMVDNPADLVQPRGETPAYEARRSVVIGKWVRGADPSGKYDASQYNGSKTSDIAK
ncbi:MAG: CpaD family pilus assembly protein [Pseudolabrys sp.]|jgi:pilus assembly protein CpaD